MKLVVLEGIDGAGTTTQARRLCEALAARGRETHLTREPSDGPVGRLLREMLTGRHQPVDNSTLALLFAADRADHVQREVAPALARGAVVVSDRWYHSSLAYQGDGDERRWVRTLNSRARTPDLTLFLEVPPEVAAERRRAARRTDELFDDLATQRRVAQAYREVIADLAASERIVTLDGELPEGEVASLVLAAAESVLR